MRVVPSARNGFTATPEVVKPVLWVVVVGTPRVSEKSHLASLALVGQSREIGRIELDLDTEIGTKL